MIFFMLLFGITLGILMSGVFLFFNRGHIPDHDLTLAGQLGFVFNAIGRICFGALSDVIGFKKTYLIVMVLQLIVCIFIVPTRDNAFAYVFFVCLSLACEGAHFSLFPSLCSRTFGVANGGLIFTFIFFAIPISANGIVAVYKNLGKNNADIFIIIGVITVLNLVIVFFFDQTPLIDESKSNDTAEKRLIVKKQQTELNLTS